MAGVPFYIAAVFASCCFNVLVLETLVTRDPGCTHLITFFGFLFVAVEGFINYYKFGAAKRNIPLRESTMHVAYFFLCNLLGNFTYSFGVSMPLVVIIRSGSLISNMLLGVFMLNKSYKVQKYVAAVILSAGISLCTVVTSDKAPNDTSSVKQTTWLIGVCLLVLSLFMGSLLGVLQERMYAEYGKHPREVLFYFHSLPLPFFLFLWRSIHEHSIVFSNSEPVQLPLLGWSAPALWLLLAANTLAQFACIRCVFYLTSEVSALSVTLVLTLRKFVSLVLSVWYYNNPFDPLHWVGSGLVFIGTVIFTEAYQVLLPSRTKQKKT